MIPLEILQDLPQEKVEKAKGWFGFGRKDEDLKIKKQQQSLVTANQKNGYEGVMDEIGKYPSYDPQSEPEQEVMPPEQQSTIEKPLPKQEMIPLPLEQVSITEDPYEILYMGG